MKKMVIYMAVILMGSACSPINSPDAENEGSLAENQVAYGLLGPGPVNYGFINGGQDEYRYDGYINQSASFRTLDRHRQDLGDDEEMIRSIVKDEKGVEPGAVFIIGKDVWVNVTIDAKNKQEREKKQTQLQKTLSKAMQRYDIHLKINDQ